MLFTWLLLSGFIVLLIPQEMTGKLHFAFARIFRLPLSMGRNVTLSAHTRYNPQSKTDRQQAQLQNHIANLTEQIQEKNRQIEMLSGLKTRFTWEGVKFQLADVITISVSGMQSTMIINRGSDDGIRSGQYVLGDNSVIGVISEVSARNSGVKLITDPDSKIEVNIEGVRINRVMQGNGNNSARIQHITTDHKIGIDSAVYAKKQPDRIDAAVIIGTVARCMVNKENPSVWEINIQPVCDMEMLKNVAVIIMDP